MSMDQDRKIKIKNFINNELDIEIGDENIEHYNQALTHYNDDRKKGTREPERLAFLGDSYLELIIRRFLFNHRNNYSVGEMNDMKQKLVPNEKWKKIAEEIGLDELIITEIQGRPVKNKIEDKNILARSFEALAAVLSFDSSVDELEEKMIHLFIKLDYL